MAHTNRLIRNDGTPWLLDGATGTWLQSHGLPPGVSLERWVLDHPQVLADLQRAYLEAGSQIIYTFTFGANRPKLLRHGYQPDEAAACNKALADISCQVRDRYLGGHPGATVLVAGDLAPTGEFLAPAGTMSFSQLVEVYSEQVSALVTSGVDLFVIETMFDLAQTRAALIAIRQQCQLPVIASMTLEPHGHTLSGDRADCCLLTLAALGADAFGLNCSQGPDELADWLRPLLRISPLPLLAKPNAGRPVQIEGQTVFPMDPQAFASRMEQLAEIGITCLGGCCGTGPEHIRQMRMMIDRQPPIPMPLSDRSEMMICSARQTWTVDPAKISTLPLIEVRKADEWVDDMMEAADNDPPAIICELSGLPDSGSPDLDDWFDTLLELQLMVHQPLIFTCPDPSAWAALRSLLTIYNGKAGITGHQAPEISGTLRITC